MNIFKTIFDKVTGLFKKSDFIEYIETYISEAEAMNESVFVPLRDNLTRDEMNGPIVRKIDQLYRRAYTQDYRSDVLTHMSATVNDSIIMAKNIIAYSNQYFDKVNSDENMSVKKRIAMIVIELLYKYLNAVTLAAQYISTEDLAEQKVTPAIEKALRNIIPEAGKIGAIINQHHDNIDSILKELPDLNIDTANAEAVIDTLRGHDRLNLGLLSLRELNPFYVIGSFIQRLRSQKLERLRKVAQIIELHIAKRQSAKNGENDAAIDDQIAYFASKLKILDQDIYDLERKLGVNHNEDGI